MKNGGFRFVFLCDKFPTLSLVSLLLSVLTRRFFLSVNSYSDGMFISFAYFEDLREHQQQFCCSFARVIQMLPVRCHDNTGDAHDTDSIEIDPVKN